MSGTLLLLLATYLLTALGAALGAVPREYFKHPAERFIVRVSCGLTWPLLFGHWLARAAVREEGER